MKTKSMREILIHALNEMKKCVEAKVCISLFIVNLLAATQLSIAQTVLFDFDNAPVHTSLPLYQTAGGITAYLSATGQGFSIQPADVLGFTPKGFSGLVIYPNSIYLSDLLIKFDHKLTNFSIMYACQELGCDDAATVRVTAYMKGAYVGTNTKTARHPGTWPVDTLKCYFAKGFDSVVMHYDSPPPTCQDYGVIYMCDNMKVIPAKDTLSAIITPSGTVSTCSNTPITLKANTGAGYTYQWYKNGVPITGATDSFYIAHNTGAYTVTISNGMSSATSAATTVTVKLSPVATISPSGTVKICPGDTVTLHAATGKNQTYQWLINNIVIGGATDSNYATTAPGSYSVIVTKLNGCSATSAITAIKNYAAASTGISYTGSLNICSTGSVTLHAKVVSGYTYQWYRNNLLITGATSSSYVATSTGSYKYKATTANGCTAFSKPKTVTGCVLASTVEKTSQRFFTIYPNPTSGNVIIVFYADKIASYKIKIVNLIGEAVMVKEVTSTKGENIQAFDLSKIAKGIYYISIETSDTLKNIQPVIVE